MHPQTAVSNTAAFAAADFREYFLKKFIKKTSLLFWNMDVPADRENRKLLSRYSAGDPVYYKEIIFEKSQIPVKRIK